MDGQRRDWLRELMADSAGVAGQNGWARAVCGVCVNVLPYADSAAMTIRADSHTREMVGASDQWGSDLEQLQYTLGEGPGVEVFHTGGPVLVADLSADQTRWPGFADAGLSAGVTAVFAFPLRVGAIRLGALTLYRRRPGGLPADQVADAAVLADLATQAMLEHTGPEGVHAEVSYDDVHVATGMLAAQLRITLQDAFVRLRGHAFAQNRLVLEVARDVLARRIPLDRLAD